MREIIAGTKIRHKSHNPLGSLMVYAIWACLVVIIASGVSMDGFPSRAFAPVIGRAVAPKTIVVPDRDDDGGTKVSEATTNGKG